MLRHTRTVVGALLSIFLLWFLFRDTDWQVLSSVLREVDVSWLFLALVLSFSSSFTRVQRWSYVVRASQPATFRSMFSATQIGLLVNLLIPARLGDVVRGYVLASLAKIPFTRSLTLVALDRINDIFAMVTVLLIALSSFPSDRDIEFAAGAFGNYEPFVVSSSLIQPVAVSLTAALFIVIIIMVFLYFRQEFVLRFLSRVLEPVSSRVAASLCEMFLNFAAGMHIFRSGMQMTKSVLLSLITWGLVALSLAAVLKAFHLEFPWYGPFLMLAILGVFTAVTVTPGMVGQYHVPVVASLLMILPGMNVNEAKAVAIVAHLLAILPPVVLGVYCMLSEQLHIHDLIPKRNTKTVE
jgi:uncharacterized protein (TIRG00374 family)